MNTTENNRFREKMSIKKQIKWLENFIDITSRMYVSSKDSQDNAFNSFGAQNALPPNMDAKELIVYLKNLKKSNFLEDLKKEWCQSKEQHKSFERDLLKFAKIINNQNS